MQFKIDNPKKVALLVIDMENDFVNLVLLCKFRWHMKPLLI